MMNVMHISEHSGDIFQKYVALFITQNLNECWRIQYIIWSM